MVFAFARSSTARGACRTIRARRARRTQRRPGSRAPHQSRTTRARSRAKNVFKYRLAMTPKRSSTFDVLRWKPVAKVRPMSSVQNVRTTHVMTCSAPPSGTSHARTYGTATPS